MSSNLLSTIDLQNDFDSFANIFEDILAQKNPNSIRNDHQSSYFHPYENYSPIIRTHSSSTHQSIFTPYSYSNLRLCTTNTRKIRRRRCYECRQQGHLKRECPFLSHRL